MSDRIGWSSELLQLLALAGRLAVHPDDEVQELAHNVPVLLDALVRARAALAVAHNRAADLRVQLNAKVVAQDKATIAVSQDDAANEWEECTVETTAEVGA